MASQIVEDFLQGKVVTVAEARENQEVPWTPNAKFKGVWLKHLITAKDTEGTFSVHLVRVEAGCEIGDHIHTTQWELHEVVEGDGMGVLDGQEIRYQPGVLVPVPVGMLHKVVAGEQDLYLMAKFVPALL